MRKYIPRPEYWSWYILKILILFSVYFTTAKIGLNLYAVNGFAALVWAPTGISIAVLILYGYDLWPGITLGAFLVNLLTGAPPIVSIGIAIGNTFEAVVATYLLRKYVDLDRLFEKLSHTIKFIILGAFVATTISAVIGGVSLVLGKIILPSDFYQTSFAWWVGDALGALVITPFLFVWLSEEKALRSWGPKWKEIVPYTLVLIFFNYLIFWNPVAQLSQIPLFYLISLPLIWATIRLGSYGITFSILITSAIATISTIFGNGPFAQMPQFEGLLYLQIFIATLSITFLIFLSIVEERKIAMQDLKSYVEKLEGAIEEVSLADKAKNNFMAILAHELRNPLAPILSSVELLKTEAKENTAITKIVKTMDNNINVMSRILDDLFDISRISKEKLAIEKEVLSVQLVIKNSVDTIIPFIKDKKHTLMISSPEKPLWVVGDQIRIQQIITNLLNNATKYTDPNGEIKIISEEKGSFVYIHITDNGIGIEPEMISSIFEPFMQLKANSKLPNNGLGIGLSLSKKLIELHDGNIEVRSNGLGKGSQFTIALPVPENSEWLNEGFEKDTENMQIQEVELVKNKKNNKKYTIMIVDDNQAAAEGLGKLLVRRGHSINIIYDGESALEEIKKSVPEIIILDIGLPMMDGYEVAKKIRNQNLLPITLIAITGYGQEEDKIKSVEAGFNFHLTKPVSIDDVDRIILDL